MKCAWFPFILIAIMASAAALAQQPGNSSPNTPGPERGGVVNSTYTNEFLGFSFPIPNGWQVNRDKAVELNAGGLRGFVLLIIEEPTGASYRNRIVTSAVDASSLTATTQHFVSVFVNAEKNQHVDWELLRDPYPVDFAGKHFFREDYKESSAERVLYKAFVCTKFRGYFLGWTLAAWSSSALEESVSSLQRISFQDELNSTRETNGLTGTVPGDQSTGNISGVIVPAPQLPAVALPQRVRVSQGVSRGLLIKKVQPRYPEDARHDHIQGQVVLQVIINKNGHRERDASLGTSFTCPCCHRGGQAMEI